MFVVDQTGELISVAEPLQGVAWRGFPRGRKVLRFAATRAADLCVALLEVDPPSRGETNLVCVDREGRELWRADAPEPPGDHFVDVALDGDRVVAHSWSCHRLVLDARTGAILERVFTK